MQWLNVNGGHIETKLKEATLAFVTYFFCCMCFCFPFVTAVVWVKSYGVVGIYSRPHGL